MIYMLDCTNDSHFVVLKKDNESENIMFKIGKRTNNVESILKIYPNINIVRKEDGDHVLQSY